MEIRRWSEEEIGYWLGMHMLPGIGFKYPAVKTLIERFSGPGAWTASRDEIMGRDQAYPAAMVDLFIAKRKTIDPEKLLIDLRKTDIDAIPLQDPRYPAPLRHIQSTPPQVLFVRGQLREDDFEKIVAVVGTRRPTSYGAKIAKQLGKELAESGVTVASGLALGIDSLAHWGAIEGGGRTIAVLASGPDLCYPSSNKRLYAKILEDGGAGISEFFPGTQPEKWHFPARNRIISGISQGVVIVEAGEASGALITADLAFQQDRDVFAIPGRVDSPMSVGTHKLIQETKARIATSAKDIMDGLDWVTTTYKDSKTIVELFGREKEIYELLTAEPLHFDMICHQTGIDAGELSATVTMLELAGLVTRHPGDWYSRIDAKLDLVDPLGRRIT